MFFPWGRHSAGSRRAPFSLEPHVWVPAGEQALLKQKTESACEGSPKLQALGGGSAKCSKGAILAQLYWNIWLSPPFLHQNLPGGFLPKATLCHAYDTVYFLGRKGKVSLQSKNRSTASLQVTRLCFFDNSCASQAWTPSELLPWQRAPCFGRWECCSVPR